MKKLVSVLTVLLLIFSGTMVFAQARPLAKDGTFLLRRQRDRLDFQLKKKYLSDPSFRKNLLSANRDGLLVGESVVGFQVYNFMSGNYEYKPGLMVAEGEHCRLFIEQANAGCWGKLAETRFKQIVETFDRQVYSTVTAWFSEPVIPSQFALYDDKIFIFLVDIKDNFSDGYVAGYFDHRDIDSLFGNQKPLFFMDINPGEPGDPDDKTNSFYRTLAHEFQHMVSYSRRLASGLEAQHRWLDEGLSMYSEFVYSGKVGKTPDCLPPSPHYERFIENPAVNLFSSSNNSWFHEDFLFRKYGASFLFVTYLIEKYGGNTSSERQDFTRRLVQKPNAGAAGLHEFLAEYDTSLQNVFKNWVVACYLNDKSLNNGKWFFESIKIFADAGFAQLPIKPVRHFYTKEQSSFVGGEGQVSPNSVNLEEIYGEGSINLGFSFEKGMTPSVVNVFKDSSASLTDLNPDESGKAEFTINLDALDRALVLPVAVELSADTDEKLHYSFTSSSQGLLLYPLPNPAFPDQFIILLRSIQSQLVATPSLKISFNNLIDSPSFTPVNDDRKLFVAHYRIPGTGKGQAICYSGEDSCSFSFSAATFRASEMIETFDGKARLYLDSSDLQTTKSAMISMPSIPVQPVFSEVVAGPYDLMISGNSAATISVETGQNMATGLGFARISDSGRLHGFRPAKLVENRINAQINESGRYYLLHDSKPPQLREFSAENSNAYCLLRLRLIDELSGIDPEEIQVRVDNLEVASEISQKDDFHYLRIQQLAAGEHLFELSFSDLAGNRQTELRQQAVAGNILMLDPEVYPNPCRNRALVRHRFSASINLISLASKIYDSSGQLVAKLDGSQIATDCLETRWDLKNHQGERVANGLYFIKTRIATNQGMFKSKAKIAVLR